MDKQERELITAQVGDWFAQSADWQRYLSRIVRQRPKVILNVVVGEGLDAYPTAEATINVTVDLYKRFDSDELEWVMIHELCHLMIPKNYQLHNWTHEIIFDCMAWLWFRLLSIDTGKITSGMGKLPSGSDTWHCEPKDRIKILKAVTSQSPFACA